MIWGFFLFLKMKQDIKKIIEDNPVALATVKSDGTPHVIAVAYVKVKNNKIVITRNYMNQTLDNIKNNPNVSLAVWDEDWNGYRIDGAAEYFEEGEWFNFIKSLKENEKEPCKGAIVISVREVVKLA